MFNFHGIDQSGEATFVCFSNTIEKFFDVMEVIHKTTMIICFKIKQFYVEFYASKMLAGQ